MAISIIFGNRSIGTAAVWRINFMIYNWELGSGHQISVDNQGAQTVVTIVHASTGQQQRSSNSFTTGIWIVPPEMSLTPTGGILKITTATGESLLQIQGNSIHMHSSHSGDRQSTSSSSTSTFTSGVEPMSPMRMQPMVMRMGDLELNMGATANQNQQRFCNQCGIPVKPTDRFCASCGNKLTVN
jgi:zinc-ribbon domain